LENHVKAALQFSPATKNYRSPMYNFTWACRGHSQLSGLRPVEGLQVVEKILRELNRKNPEANPWLHFFPNSGAAGEAQIDFVHCWRSIRVPPGQCMWSEAKRRAEVAPVFANGILGPLYDRFVNLAYHAQQLNGTNSVFFPGRILKPVLGYSHTTVSTFVRAALEEGLIVFVAPATFDPKTGKRTAARYTVNLVRIERGREHDDAVSTVVGVTKETAG